MPVELLDNLASLEFPDDDLGILASTRDEPVALTDIDVRDVVKMAVQGRLKSQGLTVPYFDNATARVRWSA
jgi:hypothetical protein